MKRGIKSETKAEQAYQAEAREFGCVVCAYRLANGLQTRGQCGATEIHHRNTGDLHGQKQLGQHAVVALCEYHHQGLPNWGWGDDEMREEYGPSFKFGRDFREWTADCFPDWPERGTAAWQRWYDEQQESGKWAA